MTNATFNRERNLTLMPIERYQLGVVFSGAFTAKRSNSPVMSCCSHGRAVLAKSNKSIVGSTPTRETSTEARMRSGRHPRQRRTESSATSARLDRPERRLDGDSPTGEGTRR